MAADNPLDDLGVPKLVLQSFLKSGRVDVERARKFLAHHYSRGISPAFHPDKDPGPDGDSFFKIVTDAWSKLEDLDDDDLARYIRDYTATGSNPLDALGVPRSILESLVNGTGRVEPHRVRTLLQKHYNGLSGAFPANRIPGDEGEMFGHIVSTAWEVLNGSTDGDLENYVTSYLNGDPTQPSAEDEERLRQAAEMIQDLGDQLRESGERVSELQLDLASRSTGGGRSGVWTALSLVALLVAGGYAGLTKLRLNKAERAGKSLRGTIAQVEAERDVEKTRFRNLQESYRGLSEAVDREEPTYCDAISGKPGAIETAVGDLIRETGKFYQRLPAAARSLAGQPGYELVFNTTDRGVAADQLFRMLANRTECLGDAATRTNVLRQTENWFPIIPAGSQVNQLTLYEVAN